jgi:hypothetical protein
LKQSRYSERELRGSAPIGILEYWNNGILGDLVLNNVEGGKMGYWFLGHFLLDTQVANIQKRITSFLNQPR